MSRERLLRDFDKDFDEIVVDLEEKYSKFDVIRSRIKKRVKNEGNISKSWSEMDDSDNGIASFDEFQKYVNRLMEEEIDMNIIKNIRTQELYQIICYMRYQALF